MRSLFLTLALVAAASCGGGVAAPATVATTAPAVTTAPAAATPTAAATSLACPQSAFEVSEGSKATVRIREQLYFIPAPFDAVMSTKAIGGEFALAADGRFDPCSLIVVDVRQLRSDDTDLHPEIIDRDRAIAELLDSPRHREATLVPQRAVGLPSPVPASGEWTFTLESTLEIRSIVKPRTWQVTAKREGNSITAKATTEFTFEEYSIERPSQVISLEDNIRLEVLLVAKAP